VTGINLFKIKQDLNISRYKEIFKNYGQVQIMGGSFSEVFKSFLQKHAVDGELEVTVDLALKLGFKGFGNYGFSPSARGALVSLGEQYTGVKIIQKPEPIIVEAAKQFLEQNITRDGNTVAGINLFKIKQDLKIFRYNKMFKDYGQVQLTGGSFNEVFKSFLQKHAVDGELTVTVDLALKLGFKKPDGKGSTFDARRALVSFGEQYTGVKIIQKQIQKPEPVIAETAKQILEQNITRDGDIVTGINLLKIKQDLNVFRYNKMFKEYGQVQLTGGSFNEVFKSFLQKHAVDGELTVTADLAFKLGLTQKAWEILIFLEEQYVSVKIIQEPLTAETVKQILEQNITRDGNTVTGINLFKIKQDLNIFRYNKMFKEYGQVQLTGGSFNEVFKSFLQKHAVDGELTVTADLAFKLGFKDPGNYGSSPTARGALISLEEQYMGVKIIQKPEPVTAEAAKPIIEQNITRDGNNTVTGINLFQIKQDLKMYGHKEMFNIYGKVQIAGGSFNKVFKSFIQTHLSGNKVKVTPDLALRLGFKKTNGNGDSSRAKAVLSSIWGLLQSQTAEFSYGKVCKEYNKAHPESPLSKDWWREPLKLQLAGRESDIDPEIYSLMLEAQQKIAPKSLRENTVIAFLPWFFGKWHSLYPKEAKEWALKTSKKAWKWGAPITTASIILGIVLNAVSLLTGFLFPLYIISTIIIDYLSLYIPIYKEHLKQNTTGKLPMTMDNNQASTAKLPAELLPRDWQNKLSKKYVQILRQRIPQLHNENNIETKVSYDFNLNVYITTRNIIRKIFDVSGSEAIVLTELNSILISSEKRNKDQLEQVVHEKFHLLFESNNPYGKRFEFRDVEEALGNMMLDEFHSYYSAILTVYGMDRITTSGEGFTMGRIMGGGITVLRKQLAALPAYLSDILQANPSDATKVNPDQILQKLRKKITESDKIILDMTKLYGFSFLDYLYELKDLDDVLKIPEQIREHPDNFTRLTEFKGGVKEPDIRAVENSIENMIEPKEITDIRHKINFIYFETSNKNEIYIENQESFAQILEKVNKLVENFEKMKKEKYLNLLKSFKKPLEAEIAKSLAPAASLKAYGIDKEIAVGKNSKNPMPLNKKTGASEQNTAPDTLPMTNWPDTKKTTIELKDGSLDVSKDLKLKQAKANRSFAKTLLVYILKIPALFYKIIKLLKITIRYKIQSIASRKFVKTKSYKNFVKILKEKEEIAKKTVIHCSVGNDTVNNFAEEGIESGYNNIVISLGEPRGGMAGSWQIDIEGKNRNIYITVKNALVSFYVQTFEEEDKKLILENSVLKISKILSGLSNFAPDKQKLSEIKQIYEQNRIFGYLNLEGINFDPGMIVVHDEGVFENAQRLFKDNIEAKIIFKHTLFAKMNKSGVTTAQESGDHNFNIESSITQEQFISKYLKQTIIKTAESLAVQRNVVCELDVTAFSSMIDEDMEDMKNMGFVLLSDVPSFSEKEMREVLFEAHRKNPDLKIYMKFEGDFDTQVVQAKQWLNHKKGEKNRYFDGAYFSFDFINVAEAERLTKSIRSDKTVMVSINKAYAEVYKTFKKYNIQVSREGALGEQENMQMECFKVSSFPRLETEEELKIYISRLSKVRAKTLIIDVNGYSDMVRSVGGILDKGIMMGWSILGMLKIRKMTKEEEVGVAIGTAYNLAKKDLPKLSKEQLKYIVKLSAEKEISDGQKDVDCQKIVEMEALKGSVIEEYLESNRNPDMKGAFVKALSQRLLVNMRNEEKGQLEFENLSNTKMLGEALWLQILIDGGLIDPKIFVEGEQDLIHKRELSERSTAEEFIENSNNEIVKLFEKVIQRDSVAITRFIYLIEKFGDRKIPDVITIEKTINMNAVKALITAA
ncbi:hypothetical protein ACFL58_03160, partial [Elusimicrobiota bacterium]